MDYLDNIILDRGQNVWSNIWRYSWDNLWISKYKEKNFDLLDTKSFYTDDAVMTIAVAKSLVKCKGKYDNLSTITIKEMQKLFNNY